MDVNSDSNHRLTQGLPPFITDQIMRKLLPKPKPPTMPDADS
jgi:hypothetical protein